MKKYILFLFMGIILIACHKRQEQSFSQCPLSIGPNDTIEMVNRHQKQLAQNNILYSPLPDTKEEWEARRPYYHAKLLEALGIDSSMFYGKREVTGFFVKEDLEYEHYSIKHLIYESLPGFWVSANLYIPKGVEFPRPAVAYFAGHSRQGKHTPNYQTTMINLARKGYIVLAPDELGGGERLFTGQINPYIYMSGLCAGGLQIWDGIRAIDYLFSRSDIVDTTRIGVTGRSGGGFQTFYLTALDDRVACGAAVHYIASFSSMIIADGPHTLDNYMIYPLRSMEQQHVLSLVSPRPFFMGCGTKDYFPVEASMDTYEKARKIYSLYQRPDNIEILTIDAGHVDTLPHREAIYAFFNNHFGVDEPAKEEEVTPEREELLNCGLNADTIATLATLAYEKNRTLPLQELSGEPLRLKIRELMGFDSRFSRSDEIGCLTVETNQSEDVYHEEVVIESEPGIYLTLQLYHHQSVRPFVLCLDDNHEQTGAFLQKGFNVMHVTPRQGSNAGKEFWYEEYVTFCNGLFLGKPLIAQKVFDIIRSIDYLQTRKELYAKSRLALINTGITEKSMHALYAAVLDERISCLAVDKPLVSFKADGPGLEAWHRRGVSSLNKSDVAYPNKLDALYRWDVSLFLPHILKYTDVDGLFSSLAPRALLISDLRNTANQPVDPEKSKKYLNGTIEAFPQGDLTIRPEFDIHAYVSFLEENCF